MLYGTVGPIREGKYLISTIDLSVETIHLSLEGDHSIGLLSKKFLDLDGVRLQHGNGGLIYLSFICCLQSSSPIIVVIIVVTVAVPLNPFLLMIPPFAKFILLSYSDTRIIILSTVPERYPYLYLIREDDNLFTITYSADGMGIGEGTLWRCIQVE